MRGVGLTTPIFVSKRYFMENNHGHIEPFWKINDVKSVQFKEDYHKDQNLINRYTQAGHNVEQMKLYNYFEPNPMPADTTIFCKLFPWLNNLSIAINKFCPGQYLPLHYDLYEKYMRLHNINNIKQIVRVMVMIEDGYPGQISQVKDRLWHSWKAGDWISWTGPEHHAVYNFSLHDRYAWQLTGVKLST